MGPGYFVIAILGCADGGTACTPVATLPTRYSFASECDAATVAARAATIAFVLATVLAQCRKSSLPAAAARSQEPRVLPVDARRG
jgi:hypothetical protein